MQVKASARVGKVIVLVFALALALLTPALAACSSDGDPYVESVEAELTTSTFPCGDARCTSGRHYCAVEPTRRVRFGASMHVYSCVALPLRCLANPRCACLDAPTCVERGGGLVVQGEEDELSSLPP